MLLLQASLVSGQMLYMHSADHHSLGIVANVVKQAPPARLLQRPEFGTGCTALSDLTGLLI